MTTYRYQLIADIEVDAPNILAAEKAVHGSWIKDIPKIRAIGSYIGGVKLPSQRREEPRCRVEVRCSYGKIKRIPR